MNKTLSVVFLFLLLSSPFYSQTKKDALKDAKIVAKATLELDINTVLEHTFPSILDIMGGKEKAKDLIKTAFDTMKQQGFVFEKAEVVSVSDIVEEQGEYRCYVENFNQMKIGDTRIKSKSFLLGIYDKENKRWLFLEADEMKNKALLEQILPGFKTSLKIPEDEVKTEKIN